MDRKNNGIHFYINNRLILRGFKSNFFTKNPNAIGISAFVDLEFNVFRPTHNKEGFDSAKDFTALVKILNEQETWISAHLTKWEHTLTEEEDCWEVLRKKYGYKNPSRENCGKDQLDEKQIAMLHEECGHWEVCRSCRQWKKLQTAQADDTCNNEGCDLNVNKSHPEAESDCNLIIAIKKSCYVL